ncbi:tetratricopeptide repeat protein [Phaeocystidibacter luteus]|uniref:Tetratricopeptide repeat protein n=2 Tax=Phaeocystidibacter luteus TaxID=911197 RepID=A0A6N6RFB9_9FLAO|nr:tetratricopeptide repeat protein [Phaeocystidibacter luteus]
MRLILMNNPKSVSMRKLCWTLSFVALANVLAFGQLTDWERSLNKVFDDGKVLYDQQMFAAAAERFDEVKERAPHDKIDVVEKSDYYRAMCAVHLMNRDAQDRVRDFLAEHPTSSYRYDALWQTADFLFNRRRYDDALEWLNEMDVREMRDNDKATYYFKKGYCHFMEEEPAEAKAAFREIKDGSSSLAPSAKYYYAHLNYNDSNYVTALREFEALQEDPAFGPMVPYYLAQIYYQTGDYDKLYEVANKLLDNATPTRSAEIAKLVGQAYFRQKRYAESLPYLQLYRERGGRMTQKEHYQLGVAYHADGQFSAALEHLNKVTANNRALAQPAFYLLADCYLKAGDKNAALSAFKATMEAPGEEAIKEEAHFNYVKLSYELANPFDNAIEALTNFKSSYPESEHITEVNELLANLYITTKDYARALEAIEATGLGSAVMREAYQKVSYYRGVELYNALNWGGATQAFTNSLRYPINAATKAQAHFWLGEIHYRRKDYSSALEEFQTFQNQSGAYNMSEFPISQYNVGYCHFMMENYNQAATTFRLFVDNRRADMSRKQDATLRLADSYFMQGKYAQAVPYYGGYIDANGRESDYASFQRALSFGLSGKEDQKVAELRALTTRYPSSTLAADAKYELGSELLRMNKYDEALSVFTQFRSDYPNSVQSRRALLQIGIIQRNMRNYDASIASLNKLVEEYPSTDEAREAISFARLVYDKAGRIDDYVDWVESIDFADVQRASLDSTVYLSAYEKYGLGDCNQAIPAFQTYLQRFPDGVFQVKANFLLAECSLGNGDKQTAKAAYERVVSGPVNDYSETAWLQLGHIAMAQSEWAKALEAYNQVVQSAESTERYRSASVGRMKAAAELERWEQASNFAEIALKDPGLSPQEKNSALLIQARGLWKIGSYEPSQRVYRTVRDSSVGEARAEASFHIAKFFLDQEMHEESNEEIFWMVDNLPNYPRWRYASLLLMAENYWKLEDIFQAQYTLDFIIEQNYSEEVVNQARSLKERINTAVAAQEAAGADTTEISIPVDAGGQGGDEGGQNEDTGGQEEGNQPEMNEQ